jgi:membrane fusion protein (multidrug efflux system)
MMLFAPDRDPRPPRFRFMGSMPLRNLALPGLALLLLTTTSCSKKTAPPPPSPEAGYVVVASQAVPLDIELVGRTTAYETADVRPQVNGVILSRRFVEGSIVQKGQTLYEIDPSLYRAAVAQAEGNLANAQAARAAAEAKAARYKPLVAIEAVAKQDYTDAVAAAQQAAANVKQTAAALETAKINLRYTTVPAPITGRIGRSLVTTGALVTGGQATALASIQRLDPIFVDIQQSSTELLALRQQLSKGGVTPASTDVRLILEDGTVYPLTGRIEFAESLVDPTTGSVTLRARFANPNNLLLPNMFVRARLAQAVAPDAILVPQQAVSRDPQGDASVMVLDAANRAVARPITATRTVGASWLVTAGLAPGERVITEGLNRIKPGEQVRPVPAGSPQPIAQSKPGGGAQQGR